MEPCPFAVRDFAGNRKAIIFVHGFHGDAHSTFGMMPAFVAGDPRLADWDVHCFGYPTALAPDITGVWAADPDLETLAGLFCTAAKVLQLKRYDKIAIVGHSMGGLVVQHALVNGGFAERVSHVLLFGTPSLGLKKAWHARVFKSQTRDMAAGSAFVTALRAAWTARYQLSGPGVFRVIAGVRDEFVTRDSSIGPFAEAQRDFVLGNHLEMVKPARLDTDSTQLLFHYLIPEQAASPADRYRKGVEEFGSRAGRLTDDEVGRYALALEFVGRQADAIQMLEKEHARSTDLTGILAGRYKRLWLSDAGGHAADGARAYELYLDAMQRAQGTGMHDQIYYNGINVAFMALAWKHSRDEAREIAGEVLRSCGRAKRTFWRLATEGEAQLHLGKLDEAVAGYEAALAFDPEPQSRERDSMYGQALWVARLIRNPLAEARVANVFGERRG